MSELAPSGSYIRPNGSIWELSATDLYLFNEGTHRHLGTKLGAQVLVDGRVAFSVWAPGARTVSVIGSFNGWDEEASPLSSLGSSGIWSAVLDDVHPGAVYKYAVRSADGRLLEKADPYALRTELPPRTASVVYDIDYLWGDDEWMRTQRARNALDAPVAIYEVHLGSWVRSPEDPAGLLGYETLTPLLIEHVVEMGFTHVEFLPVMEHPFYGSWGYQTTGFFAPSSRYGSPEQLMAMIDAFHQAGIGVLLDWVPSHFPTDSFALGEFDGTHLYEHADPRQGFHPDWKSYIFNYGRNEVRSFLASSAEHWLSAYHADGLRVDAVASMLYLDYSREQGEWIPNRFGGRENLEAVEFLRELNIGIYAEHPGAQSMAEDSTAWPGVSTPTEMGGLGFGYKWDMGWMHDTLLYFRRDPIYRGHHHNDLTFRGVYAYSEKYVLPLSHDEVVHGKASLLSAMPGDDWQRFANLRLLYGYQYMLAGKKLLFMGSEIAQWQEWSHERSLDWHLLEYAPHQGVRRFVSDLNHFYRSHAALFELDCEPSGFTWVDGGDASQSTLSFLRNAKSGESLLVVLNFTPVVREKTLGVPQAGHWVEAFNSDSLEYGGSGVENAAGGDAQDGEWDGQPYRLTVVAPPLSVVVFALDTQADQDRQGALR